MGDKGKSRNDLAAQLAARGYGPGAKDSGETRDDIKRAVRGSRTAQKQPAKPVKTAPEDRIHYRRDIPRQAPSPKPARKRNGPPVVLEESIKGMEVRHARGCGFVVTTGATDLEPVAPISSRFSEQLMDASSGLYTRVDSECDASCISPEDIIFMDVESTGLGNSPLFLIGIMVWNNGTFEIQQFFARNYAEEAAVISFFHDACEQRKLLVTFNGKSFDFPYIRARAATNGLPFSLAPDHMDMLHVCRRIWKRALPDCKLQTLEKFICKRHRQGDIPGSEIPDAYHAYVRSADAWQMVDVLKHNLLDLLTMADLMNRFPKENTD